MATRMQQRRGTAAQWISTNDGDGPILEIGEIGFETDTGKFKIGDGINNWANLDYFLDESEIDSITGDYVLSSTVGQANGIATLDGSGKLTSSQIPTSIATTTYVDDAVSNLIDSAPGALDTLNELAAAINDDASFASTITTSLGNKQDIVSGVSDTEIGYLDGVTSAIQTQLDDKLSSTNPGLIAVNSSSNALEIRQTGTGNALVVEDANNPDGTPFVIDTNGLVIRGNTSWINVGNNTSGFENHVNSGTEYGGLNLINWRNNTSMSAALHFGKAMSNVIGTQAAVSANNDLGRIGFYGSDGTDFIASSLILAEAEGTVSTGIVPGRLVISTANTSGTITERMRIDSAGLLGIGGTPSGAMVQIFNNTAANVGTIIRGAASQSGDLLQIQNSAGTVLAKFNSNAELTVPILISSGSAYVGNGVGSGAAQLEIGSNRTANGNAYIDLISDTTYTDYGLRIIRQSGANGNTFIEQRGTGALGLYVVEAGSITFSTTATERMRINSSGATTVSYTTTTGGAVRNIYMSTSTPTGGSDGDVWIQYA